MIFINSGVCLESQRISSFDSMKLRQPASKMAPKLPPYFWYSYFYVAPPPPLHLIELTPVKNVTEVTLCDFQDQVKEHCGLHLALASLALAEASCHVMWEPVMWEPVRS